MNNRCFSTIHAMIPASDYFAVYAQEEAPFYSLNRLQGIVAGRVATKYDSRSLTVTEESTEDEVAFIEIDADGLVNEPLEMENFLAICHEKDMTDELKASWTQEGKAHYEKKKKRSVAA